MKAPVWTGTGGRMAVAALWGAACVWFFVTQFHYHFFYQEQNQLFLMEGEYVDGYLGKPAWLACAAGDFLTQFYYYLYAGPVVLTAVLLVLGDMTWRCLRRMVCDAKRPLFANGLTLSIAVAMMTVEARLSLYEGYRLSGIVALVGGAALWWLHDVADEWWAGRRWWVRGLALAVVTAVAYWLFGYGMLCVLVLEAVRVATWVVRGHRAVWAVVPLAAVGAVLVLTGERVAAHYGLRAREALLYPAVMKWVEWDKAMLLERNFAYDNEYYFGHYRKVADMYEAGHEGETEEMTFFYCLSLAQLDLLPDRLMTMERPVLGTFYRIGPDTPLYTINMIDELYYLLGDMTYTERAALLANTFSPQGRNVRMVKRLAEANLVKGDEVAAEKYLRLLRKTLAYRKWASDHTPATMSAAVRAEMARKRQFLNTTDHIRVGDDCYVILTQLLDSNPRNTVALDFLLCSDIVARQKEVFHRDYERYGPRMKALYQQALTME